MYDEQDYLLLSGIQHFAFCRRQWALIHIEQQWLENRLTVEGGFLHEKAHSGETEKRGDIIITRSMPIHSRKLGISGQCDIVEFHADDNGITLFGRGGKYMPVPVEYKRGRPKTGDADVLQLCAQAMCLEEMLVCSVPMGYLYYGEQRRRLEVVMDESLRHSVTEMLEEMHECFRRGYTPRVKPSKSCGSCSLANICTPKLGRAGSAKAYILNALKGDLDK